jgi:hypothetical protein
MNKLFEKNIKKKNLGFSREKKSCVKKVCMRRWTRTSCVSVYSYLSPTQQQEQTTESEREHHEEKLQDRSPRLVGNHRRPPNSTRQAAGA